MGSILRFLPTPPAFDAPVRGFALEYCNAIWYGKTRMTWLPDDEKNLKIWLFVLTIYKCDGQTDTHTDRHCMTA